MFAPPDPAPDRTPGPRSRRGRLASVAAGVVVGAVVAVRSAGFGPELRFDVRESAMPGGAALYFVGVEVRGGETLDRIAAEGASPGVTVQRPDGFGPVPPDLGMRFVVTAEPGAPRPSRIRVTQQGRVPRTYDVPLIEATR